MPCPVLLPSTAFMFGGAYLSGRLQYKWKSQGAVVLFGALIASTALLACSFVTALWQLYLVSYMLSYCMMFFFQAIKRVHAPWETHSKCRASSTSLHPVLLCSCVCLRLLPCFKKRRTRWRWASATRSRSRPAPWWCQRGFRPGPGWPWASRRRARAWGPFT